MNLVEPCDENLLMIKKKKEQIADTYKTEFQNSYDWKRSQT